MAFLCACNPSASAINSIVFPIFSIPSLVIYPIGVVESIPHKGWGDILLELITQRESIGRPTWIVDSKGFRNCPEIESSERLRNFLKINKRLPTVSVGDYDDVDLNTQTTEETTSSTKGSINRYM